MQGFELIESRARLCDSLRQNRETPDKEGLNWDRLFQHGLSLPQAQLYPHLVSLFVCGMLGRIPVQLYVGTGHHLRMRRKPCATSTPKVGNLQPERAKARRGKTRKAESRKERSGLAKYQFSLIKTGLLNQVWDSVLVLFTEIQGLYSMSQARIRRPASGIASF